MKIFHYRTSFSGFQRSTRRDICATKACDLAQPASFKIYGIDYCGSSVDVIEDIEKRLFIVNVKLGVHSLNVRSDG